METIRHVDGPGRFSHAALDRVSGYGDTHDVSEGAAEYLCDDRGFFERVQVTDVEFTEVASDSDAASFEESIEEVRDAVAFDPTEHTNEEIADLVDGVDQVAELDAIRELEESDKDRSGALDAIDDRRDELEE